MILLIVCGSNTVVYPHTVVVKIFNTSIAHTTVLSLISCMRFTNCAVSDSISLKHFTVEIIHKSIEIKK